MVNEESNCLNLHKLASDGLAFDPYTIFENTLNQSTKTSYYLNILKNRLDSSVKRGSIVKALAIGTKEKFVLEPLSQLLEATLDKIIDS